MGGLHQDHQHSKEERQSHKVKDLRRVHFEDELRGRKSQHIAREKLEKRVRFEDEEGVSRGRARERPSRETSSKGVGDGRHGHRGPASRSWYLYLDGGRRRSRSWSRTRSRSRGRLRSRSRGAHRIAMYRGRSPRRRDGRYVTQDYTSRTWIERRGERSDEDDVYTRCGRTPSPRKRTRDSQREKIYVRGGERCRYRDEPERVTRKICYYYPKREHTNSSRRSDGRIAKRDKARDNAYVVFVRQSSPTRYGEETGYCYHEKKVDTFDKYRSSSRRSSSWPRSSQRFSPPSRKDSNAWGEFNRRYWDSYQRVCSPHAMMISSMREPFPGLARSRFASPQSSFDLTDDGDNGRRIRIRIRYRSYT